MIRINKFQLKIFQDILSNLTVNNKGIRETTDIINKL
jgi:hypothetical protein